MELVKTNCPIYHYGLDVEAFEQEDFFSNEFRSGIYFNSFEGLAFQEYGQERHWVFYEARQFFEDCSNDGCTESEWAWVANGQIEGLSNGSFDNSDSHTRKSGTYEATLKIGNLFYEPLAGTKYPIWILADQATMNGYTGAAYQYHEAKTFLFKEVVFTPSDICAYKIGGKVLRFASQELALPEANQEFDSLEDFFAKFCKIGNVDDSEDSGFLNFKTEAQEEGLQIEVPLEDQKVINSIYVNKIPNYAGWKRSLS